MTDNSDLGVLLDGLAAARLLVIGDVMLDRFIYGKVERISPEGPIPVLQIQRESLMLGGAGNVLRNAAALGVNARLIGVVGDDTTGREVAALTEGAAELITEKGRRTTQKERFVAQGQQLLRADREDPRLLTSALAAEILTAAEKHLTPGTVLVLSDYGKGLLSDEVTAGLIERARAGGHDIVVDPKGQNYRRYRGASIVTPNKKELQGATGLPVATDGEVLAACRQVVTDCGIHAVLATRSEQGMTLFDGGRGNPTAPDGQVHHLSAIARETFDVSGAGDTVVAVLAAALACGASLVDGARLANAAAGIVVGKVGTAVVHPPELLKALHSTDLMASEDKLMNLDSLLERVAIWRRSGLRVGFTNGCFDLLHPGHVSLLSQARAACDRLIVGLNSDHSVRRLKGPERPVQNEAARATVLGSLEPVSRLVVFNEDTPIKLIESIKPDVLIKGADYRLDQVVGGDIVQSYGGEILLAALKEGHSTTRTIKKLSE